jgi:hypothetical protein
MTKTKELTDQTTSNKPKLTVLACALALIVLAMLYAKAIGF